MGVTAYAHRRMASMLMVQARCDEQGAALVEYALLLVLIAVFCLLAVTFLGGAAASRLSQVGNSVAAT